ncbi:MAG: ferritin family protein [Candidatus Omnitrophota bacterium]
MEAKWSPQEILKIAIKVELNGQQLYSCLESDSEDIKIKQIWNFLKQQEIVHRQIFEDMLAKDGSLIVHEFGTGEYDAYMKAIASEYIITLKIIEEKLKTKFASDLAAVDFALSIEKESVLVYTALKNYVTEDKQHILDKIIDEEKKHIVQLIKLKRLVKKQ